jgi:hypothetical protein
MSYDEFVYKNKTIADRLDEIARRTNNMAWLGIANLCNEVFVELMKAQDQLLKAADDLLSTFEKERST